MGAEGGIDSIITWELGSYVEKVDGFCLSHYVCQCIGNLWGKKFTIDSAVKERIGVGFLGRRNYERGKQSLIIIIKIPVCYHIRCDGNCFRPHPRLIRKEK